MVGVLLERWLSAYRNISLFYIALARFIRRSHRPRSVIFASVTALNRFVILIKELVYYDID